MAPMLLTVFLISVCGVSGSIFTQMSVVKNEGNQQNIGSIFDTTGASLSSFGLEIKQIASRNRNNSQRVLGNELVVEDVEKSSVSISQDADKNSGTLKNGFINTGNTLEVDTVEDTVLDVSASSEDNDGKGQSVNSGNIREVGDVINSDIDFDSVSEDNDGGNVEGGSNSGNVDILGNVKDTDLKVEQSSESNTAESDDYTSNSGNIIYFRSLIGRKLRAFQYVN